jgi:hypothetical protein
MVMLVRQQWKDSFAMSKTNSILLARAAFTVLFVASTLVVCSPLFAQDVNLATTAPAPASTADAGETIALALAAPLSSSNAKVGEVIKFLVLQDAKIGMSDSIVSGTPVIGTVTKVRRSGPFGRSGSIELAVTSLTTTAGATLPISLEEPTSVHGRDSSGVAIVGGIVSGVIVGGAVAYGSSWEDNGLFSSHSSPVPASNGYLAGAATGLLVSYLVHGGNVNFPVGKVFYAEVSNISN